MVKAVVCRCTAAALLFAAAHAFAAEPTAIEILYVRSGMSVQIERMPQRIQAGFAHAVTGDPSSDPLPAVVVENLNDLVERAFAPAALRQSILADMRQRLAQPDITRVLDWLSSPLGRKCAALERDASTVAADRELESFVLGLRANPPDDNRVSLIQRFDDAINATNSAADMVVNMEFALSAAMLSAMPRHDDTMLADLMEHTEADRVHMRAAVGPQIFFSLLYTYRNLSDTELQQYLAFATSAAGAKYHTAAAHAMNHAFIDAGERLGQGVAELVQQAQTQSES